MGRAGWQGVVGAFFETSLRNVQPIIGIPVYDAIASHPFRRGANFGVNLSAAGRSATRIG